MEKKEAEIIVDVELPKISKDIIDEFSDRYETHCYRKGTVFYVSRALMIVICRDMKQAIRNAIKSHDMAKDEAAIR